MGRLEKIKLEGRNRNGKKNLKLKLNRERLRPGSEEINKNEQRVMKANEY